MIDYLPSYLFNASQKFPAKEDASTCSWVLRAQLDLSTMKVRPLSCFQKMSVQIVVETCFCKLRHVNCQSSVSDCVISSDMSFASQA